MTHLQKITTLAKKIRKQHPNKKWTDCVKAASNELKAGKKVAGYTGTRRDGNKTTVFYTNKKIGALPVNLHGSFLGYKFKVINQFTIEGKVEAQIVHDDKIISYIDGTKQQLDNTRKILIAGAIAAGGNLLSYRGGETKRDIKELERNIGKFVESLNNEVKNFNSGKDVRTKTQKPIKLTYKPETKKLATIDKVKKILFDDRKRLQHGYKLVPAKKLTMKKIAGEKHIDTKSHNIKVKIGRLGEFFDTTIIKDLDALKKQYFKLAKKYHPDAGGTTMQFQQLQNEYEKLLKSLLSGSNFTDEQKQNEIQLDDAMRTIINSLVNIDDINIELIGKWLWISGNTYPIYTTLKSVGLQFIKKGGEPFWVYKGVESKSRGGTPIDEIRAKYGSHKITTPKTKKISGITLTSKQKNNLKTGLKKAMSALNKRPI